MRRMHDAIIFDFDGVIADTEPLHYRSFRRVLEGVSIPLPESAYYEKYMGLSDRVMLETVLADTGRKDRIDLDALFDAKCKLYMESIGDGHDLLPGVEAFVRRVARRWSVAICSGARRCEIDAILSANGLLEYFPVVVSTEDVRTSKPDPEGFIEVLRRLNADGRGLAPGRCIVIEDSLPGIAAARAAGMRVLAVQTRQGPSDLASADASVPDLTGVDDEALRDLIN